MKWISLPAVQPVTHGVIEGAEQYLWFGRLLADWSLDRQHATSSFNFGLHFGAKPGRWLPAIELSS